MVSPYDPNVLSKEEENNETNLDEVCIFNKEKAAIRFYKILSNMSELNNEV